MGRITEYLSIDKIKELYKAGTRVKLLSMDDKQAPPIGTQGTVKYVDDMGTIHINWDNGSQLGLVMDEDSFKKL